MAATDRGPPRHLAQRVGAGRGGRARRPRPERAGKAPRARRQRADAGGGHLARQRAAARAAQVPLAVLDRSRLYANGSTRPRCASARPATRCCSGLLDAQAVQHRIDLTTASAARRIEELRRQREHRTACRSGGSMVRPRTPPSPGPVRRMRKARCALQNEGTSLAFVFFAVSALCLWLFTRPVLPGTSTAQRAYSHPVPAAVLIALMTLWWRTATPPMMFYTASAGLRADPGRSSRRARSARRPR